MNHLESNKKRSSAKLEFQFSIVETGFSSQSQTSELSHVGIKMMLPSFLTSNKLIKISTAEKRT